jgi:hypothetical protein
MEGEFFDKKGLILAKKTHWVRVGMLPLGRLLGRPSPARRPAAGGGTAG